MRHALLRGVPKPLTNLLVSRITIDAAHAREHAFHVSVENRVLRSKREHSDGGSSRAADAGQCCNLFDGLRKAPAVLVAYDLGCLVQIAPARVITQPTPVCAH